MKHRRLFAAFTATALVLSLTGCSGDDEELSFGTEESSRAETSGSQSGDDAEYDNSGRTFGDSATQLSMSSGDLQINRRTRSDNTAMGDSGWTIFVYLCGSDLESEGYAGTQDIIEAVSAQYSEDVRIVYQTGGANQWYEDAGISNSNLQRWVTVDGDIELLEELPDASMGQADTLADFVSWGVENYPAKRMGLVLWNHGGGSISGVCFDENHDYDSLSLNEIDSALNSVYDKMTDKFEFIGFDACLMSTMETANILVPYARYMFASEETEPGCGWNYTDIMNFLAENPDADGNQLGEMQCESFYQHCEEYGDSNGTTFAITDLSKMDALISAFDRTAKELYEYDDLSSIARSAYNADNFGGNNRNEGYTNMVDLRGFLNMVKQYAPSAEEALSALDSAVVHNITGIDHTGAGGLSIYYPLSFDGSTDLSIFSGICTSPYYLALVDAIGYGSTGADVSDYSNDGLFEDSDNFWNEDYTPDYTPDTTGASSAGTITGEVFFDSAGTYTVQLDDMSAFNYATCTMFMDLEDCVIYLGEDDEVNIDYDTNTITDSFDGSWPSVNGWPLAMTTVGVTSDRSIYTVPVRVNGVDTNLRIEYDWNTSTWNFIGTWDGIDPETGAAARDTQMLKAGDVIEPAYSIYSNGEEAGYFYGDPIEYSDDITVSYESLGEGTYYYSMTLYDVYGNYYYTDTVTFTCDDEGGIFYDPDELANY